MARIVQRLIGHAGADGTIADHGNRIARRLPHLARHGETKGRRNTCRRMRRAEGVVIGFAALGEP